MGELEIYTFRLVTGDEIIAKVADLTSDEITLEDARSVIIHPEGLKLGPLSLSNDPKRQYKLNKSAIVYYSLYLREEFKEAYQRAVSPLTVPTKSIITG